jgi:predicted nucleic acid-binding protein
MSGSPFLDTNICFYALNDLEPKTGIAKRLLEAGGVISVQVLNEYTNAARRKLKLSWDEIERDVFIISQFADAIIPLSPAAHALARRIAKHCNFQFYDALLLASALEAGCTRFISEDMQDGFTLDGLTIENPFRRSSP